MPIFRQENRKAEALPPRTSSRAARETRHLTAVAHRCHVFIGSNGTITVDGEEITVTEGSAETAALDHLHQLAVTMAGPVEASIVDHQRRLTLVIKVGADGASEFLKTPIPLDDLRAAFDPAQEPTAPPLEVTPPRDRFDDSAAAGTAVPRAQTVSRPDSRQAGSEPSTTVLRPVRGTRGGAASSLSSVPGTSTTLSPETAVTHAPNTASHSPAPVERLPEEGPVIDALPIPATAEPVVPPPAHGTAAQHAARPEHPAAQDPLFPVTTPPTPAPRSDEAPANGEQASRPGAEQPVTELRQAERTMRLSPVASQTDAHAPAEQTERAAWATVSVPVELQAGVNIVGEALTARDLVRAEECAAALHEEAVNMFGSTHPFALEACALHAYVAHLSGDQGKSTSLSLQVAWMRHYQSDPRAHEDLERACATWELLTSPHIAMSLGRELLLLWERLGTGNGTEGHKSVVKRLSHFSRVSAPSFAPTQFGGAPANPYLL